MLMMEAHEPTFRPVRPANSPGVMQFISELSGIVEDVGFEVKRTRDESSKGRWWYTLVRKLWLMIVADGQVNTDGASDLSQTATDMSPLELSYFRELVSSQLQEENVTD